MSYTCTSCKQKKEVGEICECEMHVPSPMEIQAEIEAIKIRLDKLEGVAPELKPGYLPNELVRAEGLNWQKCEAGHEPILFRTKVCPVCMVNFNYL
jgi:hypothetical protein